MDFRLTTFNLLAPCYKRMHSDVAPVAAIGEAGTGLLANRARTHRTARESEFDGVWRERALETVRRDRVYTGWSVLGVRFFPIRRADTAVWFGWGLFFCGGIITFFPSPATQIAHRVYVPHAGECPRCQKSQGLIRLQEVPLSRLLFVGRCETVPELRLYANGVATRCT